MPSPTPKHPAPSHSLPSTSDLTSWIDLLNKHQTLRHRTPKRLPPSPTLNKPTPLLTPHHPANPAPPEPREPISDTSSSSSSSPPWRRGEYSPTSSDLVYVMEKQERDLGDAKADAEAWRSAARAWRLCALATGVVGVVAGASAVLGGWVVVGSRGGAWGDGVVRVW
ncbi:hypothetical protein LTR08_003157 [Meristemomyces frigidus]|nr:hypothetical protein LTR08_003157 [Meristemomyces frigidus]